MPNQGPFSKKPSWPESAAVSKPCLLSCRTECSAARTHRLARNAPCQSKSRPLSLGTFKPAYSRPESLSCSLGSPCVTPCRRVGEMPATPRLSASCARYCPPGPRSLQSLHRPCRVPRCVNSGAAPLQYLRVPKGKYCADQSCLCAPRPPGSSCTHPSSSLPPSSSFARMHPGRHWYTCIYAGSRCHAKLPPVRRDAR